jgi:hypothetical protein
MGLHIQDAKLCVVAEDKCGSMKIFDVVCNPYNTNALVSMATVGLKVRVLAVLVRQYFAARVVSATACCTSSTLLALLVLTYLP